MDPSKAFLLIIGVVIGLSEGATNPSIREDTPCGDWIPYKEEKCVMVVTSVGHKTQQGAEKICAAYFGVMQGETRPKLVTVKSKEEQEFLQKLVFVDGKVKDPVWLGLKENGESGQFLWNDGTNPSFTNWANQEPSGHQHQCVVMESGSGITPRGKWVRVDCEKSNKVVCERRRTVSMETLQDLFYNYKLKQEERDKKAAKEIADLKQEITTLNQNPVPIGYIYIQLAQQEPPTTLWPQSKWTDISSRYAGLFFRAEGGNSAAFGQVQEESTIKLEQAQHLSAPLNKMTCTWSLNAIPSDGSWSENIWTGRDGGENDNCMRFRVTGKEVRPRNQAIKVWLRSA